MCIMQRHISRLSTALIRGGNVLGLTFPMINMHKVNVACLGAIWGEDRGGCQEREREREESAAEGRRRRAHEG